MDQLNQDTVDIKKKDEEDRKQIDDDHKAFKAQMKQTLFEIKDELDTVFKNPNIIN